MSEKKYAVYPGWVRSKNDGQMHHINARQLRYLYQVMPEECITVSLDHYSDPSMREFLAYAKTLIPLRPQYSGDYTLPESSLKY